jgi:hypothetical protein
MDNLILVSQLHDLEQNLAGIEKTLETSVFKEYFTSVSNLFLKKIRVLKKDIEEAKKNIAKAEDIDKGGAERDGEEVIRLAWEKYCNIRRDSQELFRECHDFLGGIAVRKGEIDNRIENICSVADNLIEKYAEEHFGKWASVAIPGEEPLKATPARLIRLRFPGWDIWDLPFAAHEFGHVVGKELGTNKEKDFYKLLEKESSSRNNDLVLHELFADSFATFFLGPAYACTSILLRFDPSLAYMERQPCTSFDNRVFVILETLNRMDQSLAGSGVLKSPPYREIIELLQNAWKGALECYQQICTISESDEKNLKKLFNEIYQILDLEYGPQVMYAKWTTAMQVAEALLKENPDHQLNGNEELRDVLNAAWYARLNNTEKIDDIGKKAPSLCQAIMNFPKKRRLSKITMQFKK